MLVVRRQEPGPRGLAATAAPLAAVVELANNTRRAHAFLPVVELFLDLVLDHLPLLFDHQDFLEAFGEAPRAVRLERPGQRDLVDAQAYVTRHTLVDAEVRECLHDIAERFAGRGDAETRARRVPHQPIES